MCTYFRGHWGIRVLDWWRTVDLFLFSFRLHHAWHMRDHIFVFRGWKLGRGGLIIMEGGFSLLLLDWDLGCWIE